MTDKERLEMIKGIQKRIKECQEKGQNVSNLHSDYVDWLIQQAERVQWLEKELKHQTEHFSISFDLLENQNKCYREALKKHL